jgi:hypothetical protein
MRLTSIPRAGDERVAELVHDQRGEEQQHARDRRQVGDAVGGVQRVRNDPDSRKISTNSIRNQVASTPIRIPATSTA